MNNTLFDSSFSPPAPDASATAQSLCPGDVPLVLLPVRIETRFFPQTGDQTELRIRIYPDKVHVDSHQRELLADERTAAMSYWQQDWTATTVDARRDAWRTLADRYGAARAAWIARVLQPTNVQQRGQTPAVEPAFPTLPPPPADVDGAWREAPQARLLPDSWTAVIHVGGAVAFTETGRDVARPLAVGPNPRATAIDEQVETAIKNGEQLAIDPGMAWMVDFDLAEAAGMGIRITMPQTTAANGLDNLIVFGVARSLGATQTSTQLADLLDAHHYTDGLEFLSYGTPTNNTDDRRAGYTTDDRDHTRSFDAEVASNPASAANAQRLGTALGLPTNGIAATLGRLGQSSRDHDLDARSMNAALWQVGWGYYLSNMIGPETGLTVDSVDWARRHFLDYVRASGPMPALRCGAQPYGILPVTSLNSWVADAGAAPQETWLKELLRKMRDGIWRPVASKVARIGMRSQQPDPDADLADLMRTDGIASGYSTRAVLGRHYMEHLFALSSQVYGPIVSAQDTIANRMLDLLGLLKQTGQRPRAARTFLSDATLALTAPLVQAGEVSPWRMLEPDYIRTLLETRDIQALIGLRPNPAATDRAVSLLQMLLRHALLRELASAAARFTAGTDSNRLATLLRDLELIDLIDIEPVAFTLQTPPQTQHWLRQLDGAAADVPAGTTIRQHLQETTDFTASQLQALGEFRTSLARLRTLDSETLELLLQGTLDLSSHRLDAWITSFATKRLTAMTQAGSVGQYVGGYGWAENLRPSTVAAQRVPDASLPTGEPGPLRYMAQDTGFIHAPSLTHATTAALLRNAHLGPTGGATAAGSPFAIDLSSRRVREAQRLLEGVRQGQPLGALLGYRFERLLHESRLDHLIAPLRRAAPLVARARGDDAAALETIAANNVVDGLVLHRRWQESTLPDLSSLYRGTGDFVALDAALERLDDAIDGLSDALTAEGAYQIARGNTSRMAGTLAAIAHGDAPPPELEVARTPRSGTSLTHRVIVPFTGVANQGSSWLSYNATARPLCERWLCAWARQLLGDARNIRCTIERLDASSGDVVETVRFPLNDVAVTCLDFVYFVGTTAQSAQLTDTLCYAEQLVLYHARRRAGGFGNDAVLRLAHARPSDLAKGEITLLDALELARAIRRSLENARGLLPSDLCPPERSSAATFDLADLEARAVRLENYLNLFHRSTENLLASKTPVRVDDVRAQLLNFGLLGICPAVPCVAVGEDDATRTALLRQAAAVLRDSAPKMNRMFALRALPVATEPLARVRQLIERGQNVCGQEFVMLPYFTLDAASASELASAIGASTQQQGGDALAVHGWFTRTARVRDNLGRLAACLRTAEAYGAGSRINMSIAQLPFDNRERWIGLPPAPGTELPPNKLSLALQSLQALNPTLQCCGLLIDEWTEVVPSKTESTALTFQFDPPNSFAPQNILIAVPPVPGQEWTTESLRNVLCETLDLAKLRAVDPSLLGAAAQYLPALYVPFNSTDAAVSTDFVPLTA